MLSISGDPSREAAATAIQAQLRRIGISLTVRPMELGSFLRAAQNDGFQILFARLGGPIDADLRPFLRSDGQFNFGHYASPRFDQLTDRAALGFDREEARRIAILMQKMLMEEQPVTVLYYPPTLVGLNPRVRGATPTWLSPFEGIETWWISGQIKTSAGAGTAPSGN
jgi:peptide/nickel transport system substrate-binding protein